MRNFTKVMACFWQKYWTKQINTRHFAVTWAVPITGIVLMSAMWLFDWNRQWFLTINGWSEITGPYVWSFLTLLGDEWVAVTLAMSFVVWRKHTLASVMVAIILTYVMVHGLKPLLLIPRPPAVFAPTEAINVIGRAYRAGSFPSGHTATIFTLAAAFVLTVNRISWLSLLAWLALALMVGLSRCVVGVHWPADVFAGMALGWLSFFLANKIAGRVSLPEWSYYSLLLIFLGSCLYTIFLHDPGYPAARIILIGIGLLSLATSAYGLYRRLLPSAQTSTTEDELHGWQTRQRTD